MINYFLKKKELAFKIVVECDDKRRTVIVNPKKHLQEFVDIECPFCNNIIRLSRCSFSVNSDEAVINGHNIEYG